MAQGPVARLREVTMERDLKTFPAHDSRAFPRTETHSYVRSEPTRRKPWRGKDVHRWMQTLSLLVCAAAAIAVAILAGIILWRINSIRTIVDNIETISTTTRSIVDGGRTLAVENGLDLAVMLRSVAPLRDQLALDDFTANLISGLDSAADVIRVLNRARFPEAAAIVTEYVGRLVSTPEAARMAQATYDWASVAMGNSTVAREEFGAAGRQMWFDGQRTLKRLADGGEQVGEEFARAVTMLSELIRDQILAFRESGLFLNIGGRRP